jgi:Nif-specific regulatory protein
MGKREPILASVDDDFEDFSHCFTGECRINVLPTLYKISQIIASSEDLEQSLEIILNAMRRSRAAP